MYKELIEAGIPKEDAQEMAKEYMKTLTAISNYINKD